MKKLMLCTLVLAGTGSVVYSSQLGSVLPSTAESVASVLPGTPAWRKSKFGLIKASRALVRLSERDDGYEAAVSSFADAARVVFSGCTRSLDGTPQSEYRVVARLCFVVAVKSGNRLVVGEILDTFSSIGINVRREALEVAAMCGDYDTMNLLVSRMPSPIVSDYSKDSPLFKAVIACRFGSFRGLFEAMSFGQDEVSEIIEIAQGRLSLALGSEEESVDDEKLGQLGQIIDFLEGN